MEEIDGILRCTPALALAFAKHNGNESDTWHSKRILKQLGPRVVITDHRRGANIQNLASSYPI